MGKVIGFFSFFVSVIHQLLGAQNNDVKSPGSTNYNSLSHDISNLDEISLLSDLRPVTKLSPVLAERLLDTAHEKHIFWKHSIFGYTLQTLACSTQPSSLKPLKWHRPITSRLFAEKKIVVPNKVGQSGSYFVYFRYLNRGPLFITLLECSCYIINARNYYKHPQPTSLDGRDDLTKSELSTKIARGKDIVIEGTSNRDAKENENGVDEIGSRTVVDGEASTSENKILNESEMTEARTVIQNDEIGVNKTRADTQTTFSSAAGGKISALDIAAEEICVNGERIYFSRGVAGDSSFFVYRLIDSSLYVIAHLVFNIT